MTSIRQLEADIKSFLAFKRALGHPYRRGAYTLRSFERYVRENVANPHHVSIEPMLRGWLARVPNRKPVTVTVDLGVIRQFCRFRRRSDPQAFVPGRDWAPQATESDFLPYIFTPQEMRLLIARAPSVCRHPLRSATLRTLIIVLYCTGLRLGEAVRLQIMDLDLAKRSFLIRESKGKTRHVPFRDDLAVILREYLLARAEVASRPDAGPLFVRPGGESMPVKVASDAIRRLLRRCGLKPTSGRTGPRPYDLRHTFAVHRLTQWYQTGVNIHARLPWLSAYMGHDDLLGTEVYLTATPELLALAGNRFERRFQGVGDAR
jgi:integrase